MIHVVSCFRGLAAGALVLAMFAPAGATRTAKVSAPASAYSYGGVVYDRLFSVIARPRFVNGVRPTQRDVRLRSLAVAPYGIIDLTPIAGNAVGGGLLDGYGSPTAVSDSGNITYYDECECAGITNNVALVLNDSGTYSRILYENEEQEGADSAIPFAISSNGNIAGEDFADYGGDIHDTAIAWSFTGFLYQSHASDMTSALAINDAGISVGHDLGPKGSHAVVYNQVPAGANRTLLAPPKNTSWIGTATGIDDTGDIVGYATFGTGEGRAVRFFKGKNAQVLPVGAAGVSTSAQAINVHGDVIGNAGSQAFLYRKNRVSYLPRPLGETAGNAVAYAVNATDEIVGDITTSTTSTAYVFENGQSYDLDALLPANSGWQIVHAAGINASGQIVGVGYYSGEGGALCGFSMKLTSPAAASRT